MANQLNVQIIEQGVRNAIVKITGILDTSNQASTVVVDPVNFSGNAPDNQSNWQHPDHFRIDYIDYSIQDQLEVTLWWAGTPDLPIVPLAGRGRMPFWNFGGLPDNASTPTGQIKLSTTGWASGTQVFTLVLELVKRYNN